MGLNCRSSLANKFCRANLHFGLFMQTVRHGFDYRFTQAEIKTPGRNRGFFVARLSISARRAQLQLVHVDDVEVGVFALRDR